MVNDILEQLGLNNKQIAVYLTVLEHGTMSPSAVGRITNINRTTVYAIAKELIGKGFMTEDLGASTTTLIATRPEDLQALIGREEIALKKKRELVEKAVEELAPLAKAVTSPIPKIKYIQERNIEEYLYQQSPVWNASLMQSDETKTWWGFQDNNIVRSFEDWIDWYWEKGSPSGIQLKLLSNQGAETIKKKKFEQRQIKFWKGSKDFTATTWVNGDYIIMIMTAQRPFYLVEIHDKVLAHNMRELFKGIWEGI